MTRLVFLLMVSISLIVSGCPKRDQPPASAYDQELLDSAARIKQQEKDERAHEEALAAQEAARAEENYEAECNRQDGGCKKGYLCWDSFYCKQGFEEQCTSSGDKMCHKKCVDNGDCPSKMPACVEKPIFHGSERGVLESFCVKSTDR